MYRLKLLNVSLFKILFILISVFYFNVFLISQNNNFKVVYDYKNDVVRYYKAKVRNNVDTFILTNSNSLTFKNNDIITVEFDNFNEFILEVKIENEKTVGHNFDSLYKNPFISFFSNSKDQISKFSDVLSSFNKIKSEVNALDRGAQSEIESTLEYINEYKLKYYSLSKQYSNILDDIDYNWNNRKAGREDFIKIKQEIINGDLLFKELISYIKDDKTVLQNFIAAKEMAAKDENFKLEMQEIDSDILQFETKGELSLTKMAEINSFLKVVVNKIDQATFKKSEEIEITENIDVIKLRFKLKDLNASTAIDLTDTQPGENYKQTWYYDKFLNTTTNEIVNSKCKDCIQLVKAQGYFKGFPPKEPETIFNDNNSKLAFGKWVFYSQSGALDREVNLENLKVNAPLENKSTAEKVVKVISISGKNNWTTKPMMGIHAVYLKNEPKEITSIISGDTLNIYGLGTGRIIPSFSTLINFEKETDSWFNPGLAIGLGYSLNKGSDFSFILGPSIKFNSIKQIGLMFGINFTRVERLKSIYKEGSNFLSPPIKNLTSSGFVQNEINIGFNFGLIMNL